MRALFYHPSPLWDGQARVFLAAARGLAARGWHVTYATASEGEPRRRALAAGLPAIGVEPDARPVLGSGELARAVRDHFVEVVFVHGERAQLAASAAVWRASRGAVVRRVGAGETLGLGRAVRTAMGRVATGFVFTWPAESGEPGSSGLGAVVADVGVPGNGAVPPAPPLDRGDEPGTRTIVCVQAPGSRLATQTVLRAAAMLAPRHPELRVRLAGPGGDDEGLRMHAAALGVTRVVIAGGPDVDAAALLPGAELAWVVADGDDGALGALDAMAAGVPVLVPRGGTAAHYVPDGIAGVHLVPGDVHATAAVMARLLAAPDTRAAMGHAGHQRVGREHTEAAMLDGFARAASVARDRTRWRA